MAFRKDKTVDVYKRQTLDPAQSARFSRTGLSPSLAGFPKTVLLNLQNLKCSP